MKIKLNKQKLKNLSLDGELLPSVMTPKIGGGLAAVDQKTGGDPCTYRPGEQTSACTIGSGCPRWHTDGC
ncbi:hypothetical protein ACSLBF_11275 [Pseudoalteromonas sp. T1lg65]|uniref:hypothetical protein n=1 Tax=Pseudoalteromonas sp. T1lg65 TaxID=2077101 RepID=UPI003F7A53DE